MPRGGGRRRGFAVRLARGVGRSKEDLTAVAGTGGSENLDLCAGAEGGSESPGGRRVGRAVRHADCGGLGSVADSALDSSSVGSALELLAPKLRPSKSRRTPRSSGSSSSSTRSSLRMLLLVSMLAAEPLRLRALPYLDLHAAPIPMPVLAEPIEEEEPLRAMILSSIA